MAEKSKKLYLVMGIMKEGHIALSGSSKVGPNISFIDKKEVVKK